MIIIILSLMASQFDSFEDRAIPLDIYQTWHTKDLQPKMAECVEKLKMANPEFQHHLFDEIECREFINSNFDDSVIEAYDSIIPKAYKADLWRYCVLYIKGGVYLDIKYYNVDGFKLIELTDREYFVRDVDESGRGIYNAFMICKPGNSVLKQCIDAIVENTRSDFYGESALAPTGPILMKRFFTSEEIDQLELTIGEQNGCPDKTCIYYKDRAILSMYKEYRDEQNQTNEPKYYDLWGKREMYEKHTLP
jgi:mannosyltransferase OCH1-like enzyme